MASSTTALRSCRRTLRLAWLGLGLGLRLGLGLGFGFGFGFWFGLGSGSGQGSGSSASPSPSRLSKAALELTLTSLHGRPATAVSAAMVRTAMVSMVPRVRGWRARTCLGGAGGELGGEHEVREDVDGEGRLQVLRR